MFLFQHGRGVLVTAIFSLSIILVTIPIVILALVKLLLPFPGPRAWCNQLLDMCADAWIRINNWQQARLLPSRLQIQGLTDVSRDHWYMLIANHQSWVDILVLLRVFGTNIPAPKFFFKRSLLWVPVLGLALWGLDFPCMRRLSKAQLERNPQLKGRDMEQTRRFCSRFRQHPVTIINFLEGTRFTPAKQATSASPFRYLLPPKAGGLSFALAAMDGQLQQLLDVTICYPQGIPRYWDYVCGRVPGIAVDTRSLPIAAKYLGDYVQDEQFRAQFQLWVNQLWREKDVRLERLRATGDS